MEVLFLLVSIVILAFPVIAIVALVKTSSLGERLSLIERRLKELEAYSPGAPRMQPAPPPVSPAPAAPTPPKSAAASPEAPRQPETDAIPEPSPAAEPPPPPPAATTPAPHVPSFEERFGTRWVVWVGGVALALGGIFLVRYSIEAGLMGPKLRLFFAALFAAALIAGGEWTRRSERNSGFAAIPSAHIPGILTAAGTMVAYATAYAAYALYGFLSPAAAFVILGSVALATLAAALLHGPALAALGIVGAFITPLLVASEEPDYWALYVFIAVVTAAAFALARYRLWRWLAIVSFLLGAAWTLPGLGATPVTALAPHLFHALTGFALAALLIVSGLFYGPAAESGKVDPTSAGALGAYLAAAALIVLASAHQGLAIWTFAAMAAASVAIAWRTEAATPAVAVAAGLVLVVMIEWAVDTHIAHLVVPGGPAAAAIPDPESARTGSHLIFGALFAALFGIAGFLAQGRSRSAVVAVLWSATAALTPIAILIALYYRIASLERSIPFAGLALLLAALFAIATETIGKRPQQPGLAAAGAIFATGGIASLALSLTFALEKGWLTVGLALMVAGIAWIAEHRPLPMLRWLAAAMAVLVLIRVGYEPRIVGDEVGTTPVFNWLLWGYGVPALSFWYAGNRLRRRSDDVPARMIESAAILFTLLLAFFEIRHYMNGGDVYRRSAGLAELALQVSAGLAMVIGLEHLRVRSRSTVHNVAALAIAGATLFGIVVGLGFAYNPMITGEPVGGAFFNLVLLGYGLPALLSILLAIHARNVRPIQYRAVAAVTAVALALAYLSLEVRRLYHGTMLTEGATSQAEGYTYSAVWLTFGVVLLLVGFLLRSQPARLASAGVMVATIGKVFLLDMAGLVGIYRALSFIGLGLVLVGIGFLYQRLLFPARANAQAAAVPKQD